MDIVTLYETWGFHWGKDLHCGLLVMTSSNPVGCYQRFGENSCCIFRVGGDGDNGFLRFAGNHLPDYTVFIIQKIIFQINRPILYSNKKECLKFVDKPVFILCSDTMKSCAYR
jgi:hypothetical protein